MTGDGYVVGFVLVTVTGTEVVTGTLVTLFGGEAEVVAGE